MAVPAKLNFLSRSGIVQWLRADKNYHLAIARFIGSDLKMKLFPRIYHFFVIFFQCKDSMACTLHAK